ncbi:hypothetical protein J8F10_28130 [Gemmata sp. G18]|uniref:Uncharacterized protein n=1 Tax=Gemmata palustris TaxID=2822762 RepID=A0ABS5BZH0_9BACT|nr:hypothetical protein [Gemmata palustris]MBP3959131.1 hypothetical protein [Gemmata palustris]
MLARVPPREFDGWVPAGIAPVNAADTTWLESVPVTIDSAGITEWYLEPDRVIGIDRKRVVVAYRSWAH